jgi:hypothetical protein
MDYFCECVGYCTKVKGIPPDWPQALLQNGICDVVGMS